MAEQRVIRVLANADAVIRALAHDGSQSPAEIAETAGIPRSTVYRLTEGLAAIGLVEQSPTSRVSLSERWLHLADAAAFRSEWAGAATVLDDLRRVTGMTTFLSLPHGDEVICIAWRPGRAIELLMMRPGRTLPLHAGAAGRVVLAFSDRPIPAPPGGLRRFTERTLTAPADLAADGVKVRERGYALSDEDVTPGIGAIGAPVYTKNGTLAGALSIGGLAGSIVRDESRLADLTIAAAEALRLNV